MADAPDPKTGSEYGGVAGLTQPPPHEPLPNETMRELYATDPADPASGGDLTTRVGAA